MNLLREFIRNILELNLLGPKAKRAPHGMRIKISKFAEPASNWNLNLPNDDNTYIDVFNIRLLIDEYQVGDYYLVPIDDKGTYETHSNIVQAYRGQGLGILMYARVFDFALRKGFKLVSSNKPSVDAIKTWKSKRLNDLFSIKKKNGRFVLIGRK